MTLKFNHTFKASSTGFCMASLYNYKRVKEGAPPEAKPRRGFLWKKTLTELATNPMPSALSRCKTLFHFLTLISHGEPEGQRC